MGVKSAERVLDILELLKEYPDGLTATEISGKLGYAPSSTFMLLKTMTEKGYLRDNQNKQYSLGARLISLGACASEYLDLNQIAGPILKKLAEQVRETVFMAILSGDEIIYVEKVNSPRSIANNAIVGGKKPVYCTGLGKAFLSFLPVEESNQILEHVQLKKITPNTITNREELKKQLAAFRKQGYAIDNEEIETGLYCFSGPLYDASGHMTAAISVSGPTSRMKENEKQILPCLLTASKEISEKLGWYGVKPKVEAEKSDK
ncbi:MAG: IclR family transcriptional regulator [Lachnospiraceae bacterium]|jgi:DNA-binding IclR family transcriptional regulator